VILLEGELADGPALKNLFIEAEKEGWPFDGVFTLPR